LMVATYSSLRGTGAMLTASTFTGKACIPACGAAAGLRQPTVATIASIEKDSMALLRTTESKDMDTIAFREVFLLIQLFGLV
jgi:hypothetical protein